MPVVTGTIDASSAEAITVAVDRQIGCHACAGGSGCGLGPVLALFTGRRDRTLTLKNSADSPYRCGDRVQVSISGNQVARLAATACGLPLAFLLGGAWAATAIFPASGDLGSITGASFGMTLAWGILRITGIEPAVRRTLQAGLSRAR